MQIRLTLEDEAATQALAQHLAAVARPGDVLLLSGPLGAGKTAFARAFIRTLSRDPGLDVPSPTFPILQLYELPGGITLHHYDLWRLDGPAGLAELDWDAAQDGIVLVEWPDRLGALSPPHALRLDFAPGSTDSARTVTLAGNERWMPS